MKTFLEYVTTPGRPAARSPASRTAAGGAEQLVERVAAGGRAARPPRSASSAVPSAARRSARRMLASVGLLARHRLAPAKPTLADRPATWRRPRCRAWPSGDRLGAAVSVPDGGVRPAGSGSAPPGAIAPSGGVGPVGLGRGRLRRRPAVGPAAAAAPASASGRRAGRRARPGGGRRCTAADGRRRAARTERLGPRRRRRRPAGRCPAVAVGWARPRRLVGWYPPAAGPAGGRRGTRCRWPGMSCRAAAAAGCPRRARRARAGHERRRTAAARSRDAYASARNAEPDRRARAGPRGPPGPTARSIGRTQPRNGPAEERAHRVLDQRGQQ